MAIVAGILVGIGLVIEFRPLHEQCVQPTTFQDATAALPFLQDHGGTIRMAVLVGSVNAALAIIMVGGLAARLHASPTRAVATVYFGIIGTAGHSLVALPYWFGIPMFVTLAARDQVAALHAWTAFAAVTSGFNDFGDFYVGLFLLTAGWAICRRKRYPSSWGGSVLSAALPPWHACLELIWRFSPHWSWRS
jgi:hypothetical protein